MEKQAVVVLAENPTETVREEPAVSQTVFAWMTLLFGYLFSRVSSAQEHPLGAFLLVVLLYAGTAILLGKQGVRLGKLPLLSVLSVLAVSITLLVASNSTVHNTAYTYAIVVYLYVLYASFGNHLQGGYSSFIVADYVRALFVLPFASMGCIFPVLATGGSKRGWKTVLRVVIGLSLAVIPTAIIGALLSYDSDFTQLMSRLFDFDFETIFSHVFSILFALPVGMYLYGAYASSKNRKCADTITADSCAAAAKKAKVLSPLTVLIAVLPILFLYVVFFISQWKYYVAGFLGILPDQTVYSEYARDGFFQLCTVAAINLVILAAISIFTARQGEDPSVVQLLLSVLLSLSTLILISTAIAKMVMYIDCYGLTPKRVYATWFMVVLTALFLLVIAQQIFRKIKLVPVGIAVCVTLFSVLGLSNADRWIAHYNVDRYLSGTLDEVDVGAMQDLGDAAIPELVRLAQELDLKNGTDIGNYAYVGYPSVDYDEYDEYEEDTVYIRVADYLYQYADKLDTDVFSLTIPRMQAHAVLEKSGILAAAQKADQW